MTKNKRDHLVDVALTLFRTEGFHATGIDRILKEAGVAKMTLYNHFKSKEDLVLAALERRDETFRSWLFARTDAEAPPGFGRILALFDGLTEWFAQEDFCGCMFTNAAAEYLGNDEPPHRLAREHKMLIRAYIHENCEIAVIPRPDQLADQIMLLAEGAIIMAHVCGDLQAGQTAKMAAASLQDAALQVSSL